MHLNHYRPARSERIQPIMQFPGRTTQEKDPASRNSVFLAGFVGSRMGK
jgi:hypothetical protein